MIVKTIINSGDINTGPVSPKLSFDGPEAISSAGHSIGAGLDAISQGVDHAAAEQYRQGLRLKQRQEYNDHIWSEGQYTAAQRQWMQWTQDVQKNGSEDVVNQFQKGFQTYQDQAVAQAPTQGSADMLKMKLDALGSQVFDSALKIQAANQAKNTVDTMSGMLSDSSDLIAQAPELYAQQQKSLQSTVDLSVQQGRISPEIGLKMKESIDDLAAQASEATISRNPQRAREILDGAEGIAWSRRKAIENEIDRAQQSNDTLFHSQQEDLFKSHLQSLEETGKPVSQFNVDTYAASFPGKSREAAKSEALQQIDMANQVYVGRSSMLGKSINDVDAVMSKHQPKDGSPDFAKQAQVYQELGKFADQQMKLQKSDPFSYARQDPIVDGAWKLVDNLPKDATPEIRQKLMGQAMDATVNFQKSLNVPDGRVSVMSVPQATIVAQTLNQGNPTQVLQTFNSLQQTYGKYYQNAFRDLARLPDGQRIDGAMQVVALHMNQPFISDFIQAVRTPNADYKIEPTDEKTLHEKVQSNGPLASFTAAMTSANPGAITYAEDFRSAVDKYAVSLLYRGKAKDPSDAVKQSTDLILNSAYGFTQVNGATIAVKRQQGRTNISDTDINGIRNQLNGASDQIDPASIDLRHFAFPQHLSTDTIQESVKNTLKNDTFWVTNPQNDGVTLFMNGMEGTSAPVQRHDGTKIELKFDDLIARENAANKARFKWPALPGMERRPNFSPGG